MEGARLGSEMEPAEMKMFGIETGSRNFHGCMANFELEEAILVFSHFIRSSTYVLNPNQISEIYPKYKSNAYLYINLAKIQLSKGIVLNIIIKSFDLKRFALILISP